MHILDPAKKRRSETGDGADLPTRRRRGTRSTRSEVPPAIDPPPGPTIVPPVSTEPPETSPPPGPKTATDRATTEAPAPPKQPSYRELTTEFADLIFGENPLAKRAALNNNIRAILSHVLTQHPISQKYRILIMFDTLTLMRQDTDRIYQALTALTETSKPIALIINSVGGEVDAGYLISKLCREFSPQLFITIVPRRAKSAPTLVCCGADQIHMGSMSELGPIDPQVSGMPALGLKNAIQHLLDLAGQFPGASDCPRKIS